MVTYGPWTQGEDFTSSEYTLARGASIIGDNVPGGQVPAYSDATGICNSATQNARDLATSAIGGSLVSQTYLNLMWGAGVVTAEGDYRAGQTLVIPSRSLPYVPLPADAIGVEWEANDCTVVGATWGFRINSGQFWFEDPDPIALPTTAHLTATADQAAIDNSTTYAAPFPIAVADFGVSATGVSNPGPVDMTPHLRPDGTFLAAFEIDRLRFESVFGDKSRQALAQTGVTIEATYTLHPPRYRFVYDTAPPTPGLPPLRQSPRDDNLGTASAARIWPSSSQQGSLRRLGYY